MYVLSDGADAVVALIQLLGTIFFIVVVVWIIKAGVRGGMKAHVQDRAAERPASTGFASAKSPSPRGIAVAARDPAGK